MDPRKTTKRVRVEKVFLIWLMVASTIFWLPSCSKTPPPPPTEPRASRSVSVPSPDAVSQQFRVEDRVFPSQVAFIQSGRVRCDQLPPSAEEERQAVEEALRRRREIARTERPAGTVNIPVFVHIITNAGGTEGDVSDAVVESQIEVLNHAYAGTAPGGTGAATPFKFVLQEIDRTGNDAWFNMTFNEVPSDLEKAAKAALNKGDKSTLNLYTLKVIDRPFGWARWPWDFDDGVDGVVVGYSTLPGGSNYFYNEGDTATHEVGHWLGLYHTFENGCDGIGDSVADTPAESGASTGCPVVVDSCPEDIGQDSVDNFMNYTYDGCMFRFTRGQSERMDAVHLEYRTP